MRWWTLAFLFIFVFPVFVHAGTTFHCNADGTFKNVKDRAGLIDYQKPHTVVWSDPCPVGSTCITKAQRDVLLAIQSKHLKCADTNPVDGEMDTILEMSLAEKQALQDTIDAAQEAAIKANAVAQANTNRIIRALAICMGQFLNETRSDPNTIKPKLTKAQGIQCIKNRINDGSAN